MPTLSVLDAARETPDALALVVGSRRLCYDELGSRVREALAWLRQRGVGSADPVAAGTSRDDARPVALVAHSSLGSLELVYALLELRVPMVLLHPRLTESERGRLVELAAPRLVVTGSWRQPATSEVRPGPVAPGPVAPGLVAPGLVAPGLGGAGDESALAVLYTSGTTGTPKGVVLSRRAFMASARASEQNLGWRPDDRWLLCLPAAHVGGLSILTRCLLGRRPVVVPASVAEGRGVDVESLLATALEHQVTLLSLVPTLAQRLVMRDRPQRPPPSLRALLLGGAAASPRLLSRLAESGWPVLTTYGLTEACSQVTTQPLGTVNRGELGAGSVIAGSELRTRADGRVQVRGATLLSGYHPPQAESPLDADGWLTTDDFGMLDERGNLHLLGRTSELIVTGGENVYPAEVERVLETLPGVARACVFGIDDEVWGQLVAAALVLDRPALPQRAGIEPGVPAPEAALPAPEAALSELEAALPARLAGHRRPRRLYVLDALVDTAAGKLDRRATARTALAAAEAARGAR